MSFGGFGILENSFFGVTGIVMGIVIGIGTGIVMGIGTGIGMGIVTGKGENEGSLVRDKCSNELRNVL